MKRLLTLFLVLWCSAAWAVEPINLARSNPYVLGAGVAGDSCTGALLLSAHFENDDDVMVGTPAGCTAYTDTTWSREQYATYSNTYAKDGTYSLKIYNGASRAYIGPTGTLPNAGTFDFWMYIVTIETYASIIVLSADNDNQINLYFSGDGAQYLTSFVASGGNSAWRVQNAAGITTGAWLHIVFKWDLTTAHDGKYSYMQVDSNTAVTSTGTPTAWSNATLSANSLYFGVNVGTHEFYIDNFKFYNTWQ